jgi:hypothetical protein
VAGRLFFLFFDTNVWLSGAEINFSGECGICYHIQMEIIAAVVTDSAQSLSVIEDEGQVRDLLVVQQSIQILKTFSFAWYSW